MWTWFRQLFWPESDAAASATRTEQAMARAQAAGYQVHYYLPAIGQEDDVELANALRWLGGTGYIITDGDGRLIGKVATRATRDQQAQARRSSMRLVVDNDSARI